MILEPLCGERIWIERLRLDMTPEQFGAISGHDAGDVAKWEADAAFPPAQAWTAWEEAGVDIGYIERKVASHDQKDIERELLTAIAERRIEWVLGHLPAQDGRNLLCAMAARGRRGLPEAGQNAPIAASATGSRAG